MAWKLSDNKIRNEIGKIYQKLFDLLDSNSHDNKKVKDLILKLENLGIKKINTNFNHRATVCSNYVIEVINEICNMDIPIVRSFERYDDYIKLLTEKQKEELKKIEEKLKLSGKKKKEIYGIYILKEILNTYKFKEIQERIPNSIIVYYGDSFDKDLPEHIGFLLNNGLVISKFGIIDKIFSHPINNIPSNWGNKYRIYEIECPNFKKKLLEYFKKYLSQTLTN